MYNLYNKNKTDDLGGQEGTNFYIPICAVLVGHQDCPNKLAEIGLIIFMLLDPISIEVLTASDGESK